MCSLGTPTAHFFRPHCPAATKKRARLADHARAVFFQMETLSHYFQDVNKLAWFMIALGVPTLITTLIIPAPFGRYSHSSWGLLLPALPCWILMEAPNLIAVAFFLDQIYKTKKGLF